MAYIKVTASATGMVNQTPFIPNKIGSRTIPDITNTNPLPMEMDIEALEYSIDCR